MNSRRDDSPELAFWWLRITPSPRSRDTLDRIPAGFRDRIAEVFVCDDASADGTYLLGLEYQKLNTDLPITVIRHKTNLGYGGNQKAGYRLAAELDLDIIVLLHADGQYAPELIPDIVAPIERGECDAVFGSRMMEKGAARAGGMPLYKYLGNRMLTTVENRTLGSRLSEFHSGYRAYYVKALRPIWIFPRPPTDSISIPRSSLPCTATARRSSKSRFRPITATRSAMSTA